MTTATVVGVVAVVAIVQLTRVELRAQHQACEQPDAEIMSAQFPMRRVETLSNSEVFWQSCLIRVAAHAKRTGRVKCCSVLVCFTATAEVQCSAVRRDWRPRSGGRHASDACERGSDQRHVAVLVLMEEKQHTHRQG